MYLDHNATTLVAPEVREVMLLFLGEAGFNPSSPYRPAQRVRAAVDRAREDVAAMLRCEPEEITFTSCATESCNLAILGTARSARAGSHFVTATTEHHAVLNAMRAVRASGHDVTVLPADRQGRIDVGEFRDALRPGTVMAAVMMVNNETGVIQDVSAMGRICRERGVLFLCDATAAIGKMPVHPHDIPCDFLALSGHKFYAPKGIGALFVRRGVKANPIMFGGEQEEGLRPGTENVAGIVGLGVASRRAVKFVESGGPESLRRIRDRIESAVRARLSGAEIIAAGAPRVCNTSSIRMNGLRNDELVVSLDADGICVSTGSACATGASLPSHVIRAMGYADDEAREVIRVSLGGENTEADADRFVSALVRSAERLKGMASAR